MENSKTACHTRRNKMYFNKAHLSALFKVKYMFPFSAEEQPCHSASAHAAYT